MKVITTRSLILNIRTRWNEQYKGFDLNLPINSYLKDIENKLKKVDLNKATKEEIKSILAHNSWTTVRCTECDNCVDWVIQLGEEPDYESSTVNICKECLKKAYEKMRE